MINRHDRKSTGKTSRTSLPDEPIKVLHRTNTFGDEIVEFKVFHETPEFYTGQVVTGDAWDIDREPRRIKKSSHFHETAAIAIEYLIDRKIRKIDHHTKELETARGELTKLTERARVITEKSASPTNEAP